MKLIFIQVAPCDLTKNNPHNHLSRKNRSWFCPLKDLTTHCPKQVVGRMTVLSRIPRSVTGINTLPAPAGLPSWGGGC